MKNAIMIMLALCALATAQGFEAEEKEKKKQAEYESQERRRRAVYASKPDDYTFVERTATWALNVVPGLGSFTIMRDWKGGGVNASIAAVGVAMFAAGWEVKTHYADSRTTTSVELGNLGYAGLAVWLGGGSVWNVYRSITYHKPGSKYFAEDRPAILNVAVLPDKNGGVTGCLVYSMAF